MTLMDKPDALGVGPAASRSAKRPWGWPQWLAVCGLPILAIGPWTLTRRLLDGPRQVTEYRQGKTIEVLGARIGEVAFVIISLMLLRLIIKGCREQGRIL